jgi:hypothetical protein
VAIETASGSTRWSVDVRTGIHPEPCPWLTLSADVDRLYCGNHDGVIEERDLRSGARTGATFDPQLGSVGDLAIADDGRELIAFGNETPAVSRWRLDGSGMVSRRIAAGHVVADGWDPTGDQLLVARRDPTATVDTDVTEFALWEDAADEPNGALEVEGLGWAGDDTLLGFALATESIEFYSAESHTIIEGVDIPRDSDHSWPSAGGRYLYSGFPDQVWTIDVRTRQRVQPTIRTEGFPRSVSATRDGKRVVVTCCWPAAADPATTVHPTARCCLRPLSTRPCRSTTSRPAPASAIRSRPPRRSSTRASSSVPDLTAQRPARHAARRSLRWSESRSDGTNRSRRGRSRARGSTQRPAVAARQKFAKNSSSSKTSSSGTSWYLVGTPSSHT